MNTSMDAVGGKDLELLSGEELSESQMRQYLIKQGCVFHPKRQLEIPDINEQKLRDIFGDNANEYKLVCDRGFRQFLAQEPISGLYDNNDQAYREWIQNLPAQVRKYYEVTNQLRRGAGLGLALMAIEAIDVLLGNETGEYSTTAIDLRKKIIEGDDGMAYNSLQTEEKIAFAQKIEDTIIIVMKNFSARNLNPSPYPLPLKSGRGLV